MKEFVSRLISVFAVLLVIVIMIAIVTSPFTLIYIISLYSETVAGWLLLCMIGLFGLYLLYIITIDVIKILKWLFIEPFKKRVE